MEERQQKSILWFIAVFITAFIFGFGLSRIPFLSGENSNTKQTNIIDENSFSHSLGEFAVTVDSQEAGGSVFIALATLTRSAWVAIHEDIGGIPGNILGARYFPAGKTAGTISLLRGTIPGSSYYAIVHKDDGDRAFDFRTDEPLQDSFGNYIMAMFETLPTENNDSFDSE